MSDLMQRLRLQSWPLAREAADELERQAARIAELERPTVYAPCEQHKGMGFTLTVTVGQPARTVCPLCAAAPAQKGGEG